MTKARLIALFVGVFAVMLIVLMPLGVALTFFGTSGSGLTARAATGDVWTGQLRDATLGPVALGDARVGLKPLPLLVGRAELGANTTAGYGRLVIGPTTQGIADTTAKLSLAAAFAPLPLASLDLDDASIRFRGDRCEQAQGRIRATFTGDVGGLALASGMSGTARCEGGDLLLPLIGQSAMERLTIHLKGSGAWRAVLSVTSNDPALAAKLSAAGFQPVAGGFALRLSGTL